MTSSTSSSLPTWPEVRYATKTGRTGLPHPAEWPPGRDWSVVESQGRYLVYDPARVFVGVVLHEISGFWVACLVGPRGGSFRGRRDQFVSYDTALRALKGWWRERALSPITPPDSPSDDPARSG